MKKLIAFALILTLALGLAACAGVPVISPTLPQDPTVPETEVPETEAPETEAPETTQPQNTAGTVKTGLAVVPTVGSSKDAGEKNGVAQSDITMVAVLVDGSGVITACAIDAIQAKVEFDAAGTVVTDLTATVPTKDELGEGYGMKGFSGIGKEWNEQMEALEAYVVGKTVEEVRGVALNERGAAADADLATSVTVSIGGLLDTICQAVENAAELGASAGDELRLAAVTTLSGSKNATAEESGAGQAAATIAAVSLREGVITSCVLDEVQCSVNFDAAGKITSDITAAPMTKNQLGEGYGMKGFSSIGMEWFEQAAAFAAYAVGKTGDEILGIALNEKGGAADADLAASVTISLGNFQAVIAKAARG